MTYSLTSGSFLVDYYTGLYTGVASPAEFASYTSGVINDVNAFQGVSIGAIASLGTGSVGGYSAASGFINGYGSLVAPLGYGLAGAEAVFRGAEGDYSGATISLAANSGGIYASGVAAEGATAIAEGFLAESVPALALDGGGLAASGTGLAATFGIGVGFSTGAGVTFAIGYGLKTEYDVFTSELGLHDPGVAIAFVPNDQGVDAPATVVFGGDGRVLPGSADFLLPPEHFDANIPVIDKGTMPADDPANFPAAPANSGVNSSSLSIFAQTGNGINALPPIDVLAANSQYWQSTVDAIVAEDNANIATWTSQINAFLADYRVAYPTLTDAGDLIDPTLNSLPPGAGDFLALYEDDAGTELGQPISADQLNLGTGMSSQNAVVDALDAAAQAGDQNAIADLISMTPPRPRSRPRKLFKIAISGPPSCKQSRRRTRPTSSARPTRSTATSRTSPRRSRRTTPTRASRPTRARR